MEVAKKRHRILLIADFVWLCVIFGHSLMPASLSAEESGWVFALLVKVFPGITHLFVRKLGHFSEFMLLGVLFALTGRFRRHLIVTALPRFWEETVPAAAAGLIAACIDEAIQLGISGRSGELRDVLIDLAGVLAGVLLILKLPFWKKGRTGEGG